MLGIEKVIHDDTNSFQKWVIKLLDMYMPNKVDLKYIKKFIKLHEEKYTFFSIIDQCGRQDICKGWMSWRTEFISFA